MNTNTYLTELFSESQSPILFIDFDGTISKRDVIDAILERFADDRWLETEEKWVNGEIGSRECLQKQFSFVKATPTELNEFLDTFELDAGFWPLLQLCRDSGIEVQIVSDGFEYYIRRMLGKAVDNCSLLDDVKIWANRLTPRGKTLWGTGFPHFEEVCPDGCATCKPAVMKQQNGCAAPAIFIGDGLSDRFAAKAADVVFAKDKLSEFCLENQIPQTTYQRLGQVAEILDQAFESFVLTSMGKRRSWLEAA